MILNRLPWKRTEIILSFLRLHPSTALCSYLKWVYDNEIFTIGYTLNCYYGGLGEEISGMFSQNNKRIRLRALSPGFQSQGTGLDCFTSWFLSPSAVNKLSMS